MQVIVLSRNRSQHSLNTVKFHVPGGVVFVQVQRCILYYAVYVALDLVVGFMEV